MPFKNEHGTLRIRMIDEFIYPNDLELFVAIFSSYRNNPWDMLKIKVFKNGLSVKNTPQVLMHCLIMASNIQPYYISDYIWQFVDISKTTLFLMQLADYSIDDIDALINRYNNEITKSKSNPHPHKQSSSNFNQQIINTATEILKTQTAIKIITKYPSQPLYSLYYYDTTARHPIKSFSQLIKKINELSQPWLLTPMNIKQYNQKLQQLKDELVLLKFNFNELIKEVESILTVSQKPKSKAQNNLASSKKFILKNETCSQIYEKTNKPHGINKKNKSQKIQQQLKENESITNPISEKLKAYRQLLTECDTQLELIKTKINQFEARTNALQTYYKFLRHHQIGYPKNSTHSLLNFSKTSIKVPFLKFVLKNTKATNDGTSNSLETNKIKPNQSNHQQLRTPPKDYESIWKNAVPLWRTNSIKLFILNAIKKNHDISGICAMLNVYSDLYAYEVEQIKNPTIWYTEFKQNSIITMHQRSTSIKHDTTIPDNITTAQKLNTFIDQLNTCKYQDAWTLTPDEIKQIKSDFGTNKEYSTISKVLNAKH